MGHILNSFFLSFIWCHWNNAVKWKKKTLIGFTKLCFTNDGPYLLLVWDTIGYWKYTLIQFFFYLVRFSWGVSWGRWFYPNFTSTDETSPGFLCNFRNTWLHCCSIVSNQFLKLWMPLDGYDIFQSIVIDFFTAQRNGYDRFDWWTPHAWKWLFKLLNYLWGCTHIVLCTV